MGEEIHGVDVERGVAGAGAYMYIYIYFIHICHIHFSNARAISPMNPSKALETVELELEAVIRSPRWIHRGNGTPPGGVLQALDDLNLPPNPNGFTRTTHEISMIMDKDG